MTMLAGRPKSRTNMAEVSWEEATWISSIVIAVIITTVGIAFFSIIILTSIR